MSEVTGPASSQAEALRVDGKTVMFVAANGVLAGLVAVADPIKPTAVEALQAIRAAGLEVIMLTGNHRRLEGTHRGAAADDFPKALTTAED